MDDSIKTEKTVVDKVADAIDGAVDVVTGLMRRGDAAFGASLIEKAQEKNRENLQNQVVGHVQTFMYELSKQRDYVASAQANMVLLDAKIAAIKEGAFTVSTYGKVAFTDERLNKATSKLAECPNCGAAWQRGGAAGIERP